MALISGSYQALLQPQHNEWTIPAMFCLEKSECSRPIRPPWKLVTHNQSRVGGCTTLRAPIGLCIMSKPEKFIEIERSLGNFLDYSNHPMEACGPQALTKNKFLSKNSIMSIKSLGKQVLLPTYK